MRANEIAWAVSMFGLVAFFIVMIVVAKYENRAFCVERGGNYVANHCVWQ